MKIPQIKPLMEALHVSKDLSTPKEVMNAIFLIVRTQEMSGGEMDTIKAAFEHGPLLDGDVPSKTNRDQMIEEGFIVKVVVKGEDGFNACTHKGAWAYRLIQVMLESERSGG